MRPVNWTSPINWNHHLNHGLLAWWLNVPHWTGGTVWRDLVGHRHGTLTTMDPVNDWVKTTHPGGWGSLSFDGSDDNILVSAADNPITGLSTITLAFWFSSTETTGLARLISTGTNDDFDIGINFSGGAVAGIPDNHLGVFIRDDGGWWDGGAVVSGQWHRVILTGDAVGKNMYIDGTGSQIDAGALVNGTDGVLTLMNRFSGGGASIGFMDDVRVLNRIWSPPQVAEDYQLSQQFYPGLLNRRGRRGVVAAAVAGPPAGSLALVGVGI